MFKKVLSLVLAACLCVGACFALTSCGKNSKVALICLHGDNSTYDKNFIDAFKAACEAKGLTEKDYTIVVNIPEGAKCFKQANKLAKAGNLAVFADSFGHEPYLKQAAEKNPGVQFFHATGTTAHTSDLDNFHDAFASIYEGRYLAGVAAGLKLLELYGEADISGASTKVVSDENAKIGYVGAYPYAEVKSGYTSFFLGVQSIVPNATMEVRFTNSWYDETAEKTTALALIDNGCKLISQHADSMGAPTACDERNIPNVAYNGATGTNTFVVASRINWQPYFELCIDYALNRGQKVAKDYVGTIGTGSVVLTDLGPAAAEGTAEKLAEVKAELVAGTRKVFDCSKFTVKNAKAYTGEFSKADYITMDADGHLTAYVADVDDFGDFNPETNVIKTDAATGITYFDESGDGFRSAPYFDIDIDGITIVDGAAK